MIPLRALLRRLTTPSVTIGIIILNFFCFYLELRQSGSLFHVANNLSLVRHYSLVPDRLSITTLFSYMFLHASWMHIAGNMWFLWVFGSHIENALGSFRFLAFYLACGVAAGAVQALLYFGSPVPTLGASGAIAGVMGAFLIIYPRIRVVTLVILIIFITTLEIPAYIMLLYWFALQLLGGLTSFEQLLGGHVVDGGGIAVFAHVGGFIAGIILVKLLPARRFLYDARS